MAHFKVGKKVICIKDHEDSGITKGMVFELLAIKKFECKCGVIVVDIGLRLQRFSRCVLCCTGGVVNNGVWWLRSSLFAPYDDSLSELTAEDILNEQFQTV